MIPLAHLIVLLGKTTYCLCVRLFDYKFYVFTRPVLIRNPFILYFVASLKLDTCGVESWTRHCHHIRLLKRLGSHQKIVIKVDRVKGVWFQLCKMVDQVKG